MFELRDKGPLEFIAQCAAYARAERHAEEQALSLFLARNPKIYADSVMVYLLKRLLFNG